MPINADPIEVHVAIVGAGFGGLGTAIRLKQAGWDDFVILERAPDVGGTWRDNTYPGCACDVPSQLYSFSFAPNPEWPHSFSRQPEIWAYLRGCVDRYGLGPHLRLGHEVRAATWDESRHRWVVRGSGLAYAARVLVLATGPLSEPDTPALPGLGTFAGTAFHSARWDPSYDPTGRRVAVIGTGASAVQLVPEIAPKVAALTVFQRTPPWVLPRRDRRLSGFEHRLYRSFPRVQRAVRAGVYWTRELAVPAFRHPLLMRLTEALARRHLRRQVPDPRLRAQLTPGYRLGCKRVLLSNDYLTALCRDNVELVTEPILEVRPDGVLTGDGRLRPVDTIIFGTGFRATDLPIAHRVRGRAGATLAERWQGSPRAYLGTSVAGFPNLFMLLGPNTTLGHTSVVFMIECQVEYLLSALAYLDRPEVVASGVAAIEPTDEAQRAFVHRVDRRMRGTVWTAGGCRSWYLDATGRNSTLWPGQTWAYRWRTRRFDPRAYAPVPAAEVAR